MPETFPILSSYRRNWSRRSVPWPIAERARAQAEHNHGQPLERLAERGGLSPAEMLCALRGQNLREMGGDPLEAEFFATIEAAAGA